MSIDLAEDENLLQNPEEWEWHINDSETLNLVMQGVQLQPNMLVKGSDVRSVYKVGELYFKIEHPESPLRQIKSRLFPKAETEFEISQTLKTAGIPVVECLGWGSCGSKNVLISQEFPGSTSVYDYFYRNFVYGNGQYEQFLEMLTDFLREFFRSGFYHDDLHFGNMLYSSKMGQIVLVDLIDIDEEEELSPSQLRRMQRVLIELREGIGEEDMLLAITACGITIDTKSAKEFFLEEVAASATRRFNEWSKRRKQILDGYSKFVTPLIQDDKIVMLAKNQLRKEIISIKKWNNPDSRERYEMKIYPTEKQARNIFLRSQFLQLCKVPHRKAAAWEMPNKIYFEPLPEEADLEITNPSGLEFFLDTLQAQEISAPLEIIAESRYGRYMLSNIDNVKTMID